MVCRTFWFQFIMYLFKDFILAKNAWKVDRVPIISLQLYLKVKSNKVNVAKGKLNIEDDIINQCLKVRAAFVIRLSRVDGFYTALG